MTCRMLFLTLCLAALALPGVAQLSLGLSAGPTLAFREWKFKQPIGGLNGVDYQPGLSGQASLLAEYALSPWLALRAETGLQVWRNRLSVEVTDLNGGSTRATMKDDLETWTGALSLRVMPLRNKNYYLLAGSTLGSVLRNRGSIDKDLIEGPGRIELQNGLENHTHYFVHLGLGSTFACGPRGKVLFEARYQYGLNKLFESTNVVARISTLLLSAGYLYTL
ncbi:MAG: hypothetical protein IT260_14675 [Saprospiraceae bacterium]|nr:hypothetical protein [Saprospiraceae bacterium]